MGDATRDCPPFPSMVVSKHMLSAKKTPICGIYKVDQSVTARYNFVVEPGLPVSPPSKVARLFFCRPPVACGFLCTDRALCGVIQDDGNFGE
jgi:hypothetical protein